MITVNTRMDASTPEEIFAEINTRMTGALMFHSQMIDYFAFLGLDGYKQIHVRQYTDESQERTDLKQYYISKHEQILYDGFSGTVEVIPETWKNAKSMSVGKGTKQKAVEDGFLMYREWESKTKDIYEHYVNTLRDGGHIIDALEVERLAANVADELDMIDHIMLDLISTGYDMTYIVESQTDLCKGRKEGKHGKHC